MAKKPDDDQISDPTENEDILTAEDPEGQAAEDGHDGGDDEGVETLKQQLAAANKAREDAEKARAEAERRAAEREAESRRITEESQRQRGELEDSRLQTIQNAIAAKEAQRKDLRARLIAAKSSADYEAEADLNIELADIATDLRQLTAGKNQLENRITEEREAARNPQPQLPADPLERAVHGMTPRAAAWVRSHPEVISDPVRNAELVLADKLAQRAGIDPNSDAYFAHMDDRMGYGEQAATNVRRAPSAPAAPPNRPGSPGDPQPGQIRLSRAEREMADDLGMSYADYARYSRENPYRTQH